MGRGRRYTKTFTLLATFPVSLEHALVCFAAASVLRRCGFRRRHSRQAPRGLGSRFPGGVDGHARGWSDTPLWPLVLASLLHDEASERRPLRSPPLPERLLRLDDGPRRIISFISVVPRPSRPTR